ncbi:uncharacterized protein BO95DRAFT_441370 [Aspergillus brunneoviolaceus CBS 621.78]|uniref:Uncharacterized protein n=1 Tax=Aspergillus brunneoviolaceus CBS 621.78 TaxID=1450534 RepID=A0ACD1GD77_9EURO|nr:hypothetical protein BO95DRAFT_441370 [Aspergillus brunneoviolaceus CBS 621.78]RAH47234.1 hypothetical protein BO95DRAFT_441370 [Aspergillus brunneoviolaceus CBS 621.78]
MENLDFTVAPVDLVLNWPDVHGLELSLPLDVFDSPVNDVNDVNQNTLHSNCITEPCDSCRQMLLDSSVLEPDLLSNSSSYKDCIVPEPESSHTYPQSQQWSDTHREAPSADPNASEGAAIMCDHDRRLRKRSDYNKFPRETIRILKEWLSQHQDHPYPSKEERRELLLRTGLTPTQLRNWFANTRRREKEKAHSAPARRTDLIQAATSSMTSSMTPLERWQNSPPEEESAAFSDIARALSKRPSTPRPQLSFTSSNPSSASSVDWASHPSHVEQWGVLPASSGSSLDTSASSTSSLSNTSAHSYHSFSRSESQDQNRRRRRHSRRSKLHIPANTIASRRARGSRRFQCTFCTDTFSTKYDWQRHEKSMHIPLDEWRCAPSGAIVPLDGGHVCAFCLHPNPDQEHLDVHEYSICQERSPLERTFYRKDHLHQHLRSVHSVKFVAASMSGWKSSVTDIKSRCGFCDARFHSWTARADHLAAHYKQGVDMREWQGDWGFEPELLRLVENAMPPYLIGQEQLAPNPFSASAITVLKPSWETDQPAQLPEQENLNFWPVIQRELTEYITRQLASKVVPTDKMLQDHARMIVYGCDDGWNQTCADNPVWLSNLKRDAGLDAFQSQNCDTQVPLAATESWQWPLFEFDPPVHGFEDLHLEPQQPAYQNPYQ